MNKSKAEKAAYCQYAQNRHAEIVQKVERKNMSKYMLTYK